MARPPPPGENRAMAHDNPADARPPLARIRVWLWLMVPALLAVGIALLLATRTATPTQAADPAEAIGGSFAMVDQDGRAVTDETLRGRPYAIFFGFTRCPDICPTTLSRLARWRADLGEDGERFDIVFVSVDPEYDTRADIGNYLSLFDMPVTGLTGTDEQVTQIADAFKIYHRKVPVAGGGYTIDHTTAVFLMDAEGSFVEAIGHLDQGEVAMDKLRRLVSA